MGSAFPHRGPPPPGPSPTWAGNPSLPALGLRLWSCPARRPFPSARGALCARGDAMDGPEMPLGSDGRPSIPHSGGCVDQTAFREAWPS